MPSPPRTLTLHVACVVCAWKAQHTGDTAVEVTAFLRWLITAHYDDAHPTVAPQRGVLTVPLSHIGVVSLEELRGAWTNAESRRVS